jgi:hypothetical protein
MSNALSGTGLLSIAVTCSVILPSLPQTLILVGLVLAVAADPAGGALSYFFCAWFPRWSLLM